MEIGLLRGTVALEEYTERYAALAQETIELLWKLLGGDAVDIQHVGSTSIRGIKSKPIIDLAVAVRSFDDMHRHDQVLFDAGIYYRKQDVPEQQLYVIGEGEVRTHHIHVVIYGTSAWCNYLNFRDYLNQRPEIAYQYSELKEKLAAKYPNDRGAYTKGKASLIDKILDDAKIWREIEEKQWELEKKSPETEPARLGLEPELPLTEFDPDKQGLIDPVRLLADEPRVPKVFISCFASHSFERLRERLGNTQELGVSKCANHWTPYYKASYQGMEIGLVCAEVGAPACVGMFDELFALGAETVILYGNCGVLDGSIQDLSIILPTSAVRDEGTSFHYAPPSREIPVNIKYGALFEEMLQELKIPYHKGKCWTTDAFYRETAMKVQKRKEEGCICVDMEASAMAALAALRGKDVLQFFYAGDNLDGPSWDSRSLSQLLRLEDKDSVGLIALEAAKRIQAM